MEAALQGPPGTRWRSVALSDLAREFSLRSFRHPVTDCLEWTTGRTHVRQDFVGVVAPDSLIDEDGHLFLPRCRVLCASEQNLRFLHTAAATRKNDGYHEWDDSTVVTRRQGHGFVLGGHRGGNHWHFLVNFFPRLAMMRAYAPGWLEECDKILVAPGLSRFQRELLEMLDLPRPMEPLPQGRDRVDHYDALTCVSLQKNLWMSREVLAGVRKMLWSIAAEPTGRTTRILLQRIFDHPKRRVFNQEQVSEVLAPYGFEPFVAERHSCAEQIALYRDADAVIAPHGAGLANLLACKPGTLVVVFEYGDPSMMTALAQQLDLRPVLMRCKQHVDRAYEASVPRFETRYRDLIVDVCELKKILERELRNKG